MDILSAIKREERKLEKQLTLIQHKLKGIKAAAEAIGRTADKNVKKGTKRVLSAAARAKIGKAAKKRWARFRAEAKKIPRYRTDFPQDATRATVREPRSSRGGASLVLRRPLVETLLHRLVVVSPFYRFRNLAFGGSRGPRTQRAVDW